jgi:predicted CoA-substrate-specific enzyme activase
MICAGIDAGSRTIKAVLVDTQSLELLAEGVADQGIAQDALADRLLEQLREQAGIERREIRSIVATGYGRKLIRMADTAVTEITCQAWGVRHRMPEARTIVDIGGQDSKLIHLTEDGTVADFAMNDRCAAGTGRFLEIVATRLGVELGSLGQLAQACTLPVSINSTCVVFAETEIVGLLASGVGRAEIAAGVQAAIAARTATLAGRNAIQPIVFTGGVALVPGMAAALERILDQPVLVASHAQTTAALGAAILAGQRANGQAQPKEWPPKGAVEVPRESC